MPQNKMPVWHPRGFPLPQGATVACKETRSHSNLDPKRIPVTMRVGDVAEVRPSPMGVDDGSPELGGAMVLASAAGVLQYQAVAPGRAVLRVGWHSGDHGGGHIVDYGTPVLYEVTVTQTGGPPSTGPHRVGS